MFSSKLFVFAAIKGVIILNGRVFVMIVKNFKRQISIKLNREEKKTICLSNL